MDTGEGKGKIRDMGRALDYNEVSPGVRKEGEESEGYDWAAAIEEDARLMASLVRRERIRLAKLRELDPEELEKLMASHPQEFGLLRLRRKALKDALGVGGADRNGGGGAVGSGEKVVRHKQEGHIPDNLVTAYEALWVKTYGSDAAFMGDPNALTKIEGKGESKRGVVGKGNPMRMKDSSERVYRSGATPPKGRGSGKSIIKDESAFEFKRKMDKRMRRMASEIDQWIRKGKLVEVKRDTVSDGEGSGHKCPGCKRYAEVDWRFCARCGMSMCDDKTT